MTDFAVDTEGLRRRSAPVNQDTMLTVPSWFVLITDRERDAICDELDRLRAENARLTAENTRLMEEARP